MLFFLAILAAPHVRFSPNFSSLGDLEETYPDYHNLLTSCQYSDLKTFNQCLHSANDLLILHLNIRSLQKNFDEFQSLIDSMKSKPHVILVTETWLDPLLSQSYMLNNYRLEVSSLTEFRGKGVAIYIDNSLTYSRRGELESSTKEFQSIFLDIRVSHKTFIIGAVYRSPSFPANAFLDPLEETLEKVNDGHKPCLIGGDFNFDLLKHNTDDTSSNFVNLLASSGFLPCISLPTRITSQSSTLVDNFFCNDLSLVESSMVLLNDISDHLPICARVSMKANIQINSDKSCSKFDFRKIEILKKKLSLKLSEFYKITNAEDASCLLIGTISKEIENLSIKSTSRRSAPMQPWISYSLLWCINRKNHLHKNCVFTLRSKSCDVQKLS